MNPDRRLRQPPEAAPEAEPNSGPVIVALAEGLTAVRGRRGAGLGVARGVARLTLRRPLLTLLGVACASTSGVALLLHAAGFLPLYFLVDALGPPSLVLLVAIGVYSRRVEETVLTSRLATGLLAGLAATAAYDVVRLLLRLSGIIGFDPFLTQPIFGGLITGAPLGSPVAVGAGWIYHLWNGVGFALMYTLVAGPANPFYALGWALFLEIAWLTALPSALDFTLRPDLIVVSLIGHTAYGLTLGLLSRRWARL